MVLGKTGNDFEDPTPPRHVYCSCSLDLGHGDFVFSGGFSREVLAYLHFFLFFFFFYWADVDPGGFL